MTVGVSCDTIEQRKGNGEEMRITRKDIAKYAGVSEQTVSYVLNGTRKFSDDVVQRVQKAMKDLNYKPDMIAKSMVTKRTHTMAIIVRDVVNPIFPAVIHGFQERASQCGYSVYISDIAGGVDVNSQITDLIARRIDGVYLSLLNDSDVNELVERFISNDIQVVLGNKYTNVASDVPCVLTDFTAGMRKIVTYLREHGHKDIVYLSGLDVCADNDERYVSFVRAYREAFGKEPCSIGNEPPFGTEVEDGVRMNEKMLALGLPCTAVVTTNDLMAYGVIDCLKAHGKSVPDDVSVVGIDDILYSKYVDPPLTTLGYDFHEIGRKVFDTLEKRVSGGKCDDAVVETRIVERESVKKL